jgi:hypothetical protein
MTTGRPGRYVVLAAGLALLTATGCGGVSRRFVVESNVPNAQVYINDKPIGAAPAHATFEYYGYYKIDLVHPDCQRETRRVHVVAPWYAYPPFDFLAEVIWPFQVEDVRRYYFNLQPAVRPDTGELIMNAEKLRERGMNLPPPDEPAQPRPVAPDRGRVLPGHGPETVPPAAPIPTPVPEPAPNRLIPNVGPTGVSR